MLFDSTSDASLSQVAVDCCLNLGSSPSDVLGIIHAKELAQATLAEATAKQLLAEKAKAASEAGTDSCDVTRAATHTAPPHSSVIDQATLDTPICNLIKKRKHIAKALAPARVLLRSTPARQARVHSQVSQ